MLLPATAADAAACLDDGLSVLQAGGARARSTLLATNVLVELASPSGAQLWACIAEAFDGQLTSALAVAHSSGRLLKQRATHAAPEAALGNGVFCKRRATHAAAVVACSSGVFRKQRAALSHRI